MIKLTINACLFLLLFPTFVFAANYYHINKDNLTVLSGPHYEKSTYVKKLTKSGNPEVLDLLLFNLVPEVRPSLAIEQTYSGAKTVFADRVELVIRDKTVDELSDDRDFNIERIGNAYRGHLTDYAHWSSGPEIFDKAKANKPKAKAIKEWVNTCRSQYFTNKANLKAGVKFDESWLVYPEPPYGLEEVLDEV